LNCRKTLKTNPAGTSNIGGGMTLEQAFNDFLEDVLKKAAKMLQENGIKIHCISLSKRLGIPESWKCISISNSTNVYYRIGKTKPRKGPRKGQEFLVIDLVMDGYKKKVFVPLLKKRENIERKLGTTLERESPGLEATGQYRLKLIMPEEVYYKRNVRYAANQLANFIMTTKPYLTELGVV